MLSLSPTFQKLEVCSALFIFKHFTFLFFLFAEMLPSYQNYQSQMGSKFATAKKESVDEVF